MTVHLRTLVQDMYRYLDLATFDVVVNLEGETPSFTGRIRVPQFRESEIALFLARFGVTETTWVKLHTPGWREVIFPIIPYESIRR